MREEIARLRKKTPGNKRYSGEETITMTLTPTETALELCRKAEKQVESQPGTTGAPDAIRLLHELQVHQAELEIQNEELRNTVEQLRQSEESLDREISLRTKQEAALLESTEKYRAIIEAFSGYLYICSRDNRIEFMNARLIERTGRDATGETCFMALHDLYDVCEWCVNDKVFAGETVHWEIQSPKDGRWYEVDNSPVYNPDGTISKQAMIVDITERKQLECDKLALEQQLQQARKLESLGVLAGGIAHDFNNILQVIIGSCGLIKNDITTAESFIPQIEKAAARAVGLCNQMLAYAGKSTSPRSLIVMWMLLDEMVHILQSDIGKNIIINTSYSPDLPLIEGDAGQLTQIITNLFLNASEAIGQAPGKIHIALTRTEISPGESPADYLGKAITPGTYLCMEISDTGCGMNTETQQRIFEPFFTTKFTGRGLGMSAVLGIITSHDGTLQLSSQPGNGTTIRVYLPATAMSTPARQAYTDGADSSGWRGHGTVLLVEDEEMIIDIAKSLLEEMGFLVVEAANGAEALEQYQMHENEITLVLTDIGMPVMDGYALIRELKQRTPRLRIIVASGFGEAAIYSRIDRKEIAGMLRKPYTCDQLKEVMMSVAGAA